MIHEFAELGLAASALRTARQQLQQQSQQSQPQPQKSQQQQHDAAATLKAFLSRLTYVSSFDNLYVLHIVHPSCFIWPPTNVLLKHLTLIVVWMFVCVSFCVCVGLLRVSIALNTSFIY